MFDILDKQIAEDFSKKSVENDAKAKEDEAEKTEEKLRNLAKKQAEYEKEGPTKSGVYRLENYLNNFIIDSEPAKIEELPKPSEVKKSKSPVKVEQKPIIKEVEMPKNVTKEKSKSAASKENLSEVVEAKNEESKPTAKIDPVKPKVAEAPKQPSKIFLDFYMGCPPPRFGPICGPATIPVVGDVSLDENVKPAAQNEAIMIEENFLDQVKTYANVAPKEAVPISDFDNFLNEVSESEPSSNNAVPLLEDELLDSMDGNKSGVKYYKNAKPVAPKEDVQILGADNFLNEVSESGTLDKIGVVEPGAKIIEEKDFLGLIQFPAKNCGTTIDDEDFLNQVSDKKSVPLKEQQESSDSSKTSTKSKTPPPRVNHLLNFWLENDFPFSDFVVFFQYLYYHVERLGCVDTLSFKIYEDLVDAVVRREHIFHSRHEHVSNIPLMCRYKFLIFDDNYPEYILINPELLKLQMYPLIGGLPTAVMYLFKIKREWLISDLIKGFSDCSKAEFYRQLCNFLNDRPDLVMLQSPRPKATFPEMYIVLNDHISLKFCCYMFTLKDLNVAEKLHLRNDHIKSMKQFIPYR
uniref:Uncharacterized protein n=1 Tax=Panagrolaimus davidi TaxID=227884 RepID=A0A914Q3H2_9BILA